MAICLPHAVEVESTLHYISAWSFGDPHINTLDNLAYTFNGLGEYTLLSTINSTFLLQGRTARVQDANGTYGDATVFSAFAAKDLTSDKVHVMMNTTSNGGWINVEFVLFLLYICVFKISFFAFPQSRSSDTFGLCSCVLKIVACFVTESLFWNSINQLF